MTGCLVQKNKRYYMVFNVYENGKRKRLWRATGLPVEGNKRRAEQMLQETLVQLSKLPWYDPDRAEYCSTPFSAYVRQWLQVAKSRVDEVTYQGYKILAETHVLPYFDALGVKLKDVTVGVLQTYLDTKHVSGRVDGKGGLSPRSVRMHKNILYQTLEEAVRNGLLLSNPCRHVVLPTMDRKRANFYPAETLQALFAAVQGDLLYPLIKVTAVYGLRRSEVLGLQWDSVDFAHRMLTIRHTVSKVSAVVEKDKTKTASSYRSFPLLPEIEALLRRRKEEQEQNRAQLGRKYHESDYIFTWSDGRLFSPDYVTDHFSRLLKRHGFPHIRFHELRHSCASLLLSQGFTLKDVQEWMGHADIKVTANIYGHLDLARKHGIADRLDAMLAEQ